MVDISIGATLVFTPANLEVRAAGDYAIEYQGRIYKLYLFTGTFMPENKRSNSGAYQGAKFFTYQGKIFG